jgi:hypothetical protein
VGGASSSSKKLSEGVSGQWSVAGFGSISLFPSHSSLFNSPSMKKQIGEVIAHFPDETILLWVLARY